MGFVCFVCSAAYQITHRKNSSNSNAATVDVLSPSARQYTATTLKAESVYVFRLTAQTRKGWGEAAEALVVTTEKRGACVCVCGGVVLIFNNSHLQVQLENKSFVRVL